MNDVIEVKGINGTISFDGRLVKIRRSGIWTKNFGREERVYPLARISGVELNKGSLITHGSLTIRPSGVEARRGKPDKNPDAVIFRTGRYDRFAAFRDAILAAM